MFNQKLYKISLMWGALLKLSDSMAGESKNWNCTF